MSKPNRRKYAIADYAARKVEHMNRIGIGASLVGGRAVPSWKTEKSKGGLTFERAETFYVRNGAGKIVERWTCTHAAHKGKPPRFRVQTGARI